MHTVVLTFDDGYEDNFREVLPILKEFGYPATIFLSAGHIGTEREVRSVTLRHLTQTQIREMSSSGLVDFQSHGMTHRKLTDLSDDQVWNEIRASKDIIRNLNGHESRIFAYPFGAVNNIVRGIVAQEFDAAVGVVRGYADVRSDVLQLPRQSVDSLIGHRRFILRI